MPVQSPKPSPVLHRLERRRRALSGLAETPFIVWSSGWMEVEVYDETLPQPAKLADVLAACPVGAFGIPRQDHP